MSERFEPGRGVQQTELQGGFSQVEVACADPLTALSVLADANVSHKFLKLRPDGIAFIVPRDRLDVALSTLADFPTSVAEEVAVVLVRCPGLREQARVVATSASALLDAGVSILHSGDMHDRAYFVVPVHDGPSARQSLERELFS